MPNSPPSDSFKQNLLLWTPTKSEGQIHQRSNSPTAKVKEETKNKKTPLKEAPNGTLPPHCAVAAKCSLPQLTSQTHYSLCSPLLEIFSKPLCSSLPVLHSSYLKAQVPSLIVLGIWPEQCKDCIVNRSFPGGGGQKMSRGLRLHVPHPVPAPPPKAARSCLADQFGPQCQ